GGVRTGRRPPAGTCMADFPTRRPGLTLAFALLLAAPAAAQVPDAQVYYTRQPEVRVPFGRDVSGRLRQVQLYVSTDQGRDWRLAESAPPDAGSFPPYAAPNDGTYWFAVRAV